MKKVLLTVCAVLASVLLAFSSTGSAFAKKTSTVTVPSEKECADLGVDWQDKNEDCKKYCVEVSYLGTLGQDGKTRLSCDDGSGKAMVDTLVLVVDIFSAVVGVLAVGGIIFIGIRYLTSGGDVAKATKARKRLVELVIGIVIYAVMYTVLKFLIPSFSSNEKDVVVEPTSVRETTSIVAKN